jgi:hypothetical protein
MGVPGVSLVGVVPAPLVDGGAGSPNGPKGSAGVEFEVLAGAPNGFSSAGWESVGGVAAERGVSRSPAGVSVEVAPVGFVPPGGGPNGLGRVS